MAVLSTEEVVWVVTSSRAGWLGVDAAWVVDLTDSGQRGRIVVPGTEGADWMLGCSMG